MRPHPLAQHPGDLPEDPNRLLAPARSGAEDWPLYPTMTAPTTQRLTGGYAPQQAATVGEKYDLYLECIDMIRCALGTPQELWGNRLNAAVLADILVRTSQPEDWVTSDWQVFEAWRAGKAVALTPKISNPASTTAVTLPAATVVGKAPPPTILEDLAASLSMDEDGREWLEETVDLLKHKGQLIIQGPPGTGKTYIGRKLAEFLAGDPARVTVTQFHPGTSYEDFVQGLRPDPDNPTSSAP